MIKENETMVKKRLLANLRGVKKCEATRGAGNSMSGTVELGEYRHAHWSATRETS
jgi:hypothetical protein